ncbi:hypothetical protein [Microcoleus sp. FACHB-672]|uniref:hypothetical protein n=1 Tax=Microcoleus sp. FACHB-672 TaxID=2692825 RepID=UPI0018EFDA29|nr:hypothetical protein [Microcoleus sp. FACHB-672]
MVDTDALLLDMHSFIPNEMAIAHSHPLAKNLELPIPDPRQATPAEIQKIQLRDRVPGIVKRIIPLDALVAWEYWWCVPGRLLLPEDVELLQRDRSRVESILSKLVWLLGGYCFTTDTCWEGEQPIVYDWQQILAVAGKQGFESYLLDIDFFTTAIKADNRQAGVAAGTQTPTHIAVEPAHWHIEFFQVQPAAGGFEIKEPKPLCGCQIWMAKPFIKNLQTGETLTRYDLWLSNPHNVTNPPWLN